MKIGDRVAKNDGGVGHIESIGERFADVRWQTPHNTPSCCVGTCDIKELIPVSDNVLPQPRSREWYFYL